MVTQKTQYGLRALYELATRSETAPTRIEDIAKAQAIPQRFLEVVLNELKHAGLVEARRGPRGGYLLARSPRDITVADVIACCQGRFTPVEGDGAFVSLWEEVRAAVNHVYESTTLQDLVTREETRLAKAALNYSI